MNYETNNFWNDLTDDETDELLARAAGGEAVFCEDLLLLVAA
jgi:hypothetical protein